MSPSAVRWLRPLAWVTSCAVLLAGLVIGARSDSVSASTTHDIVAYLGPMAVAALLATVLATRTRTSLERSFWARLAVCLVLLFVAEAQWTWYVAVIDPGGPSTMMPFVLLYVIALGLLLSLLATVTRPIVGTPWRHVRLVADVAAGAWAAIPFVYLGWTYGLLGGLAAAGVAPAVVAAVYPVVGGLVAGGTAVVMSTRQVRARYRWEWIVASSLWVFSAGLCLFPLWRMQALTSGGAAPTWFTSVLGAAYLVLGVGEMYRLNTTTDRGEAFERPRTLPEAHPRWLAQLYPVAVTAALVALGWLSLRYGRTEWGEPLAFFAVTLSVLLAARSAIAALETAAYHRSALSDPQTGARVRSVFDARLVDAVFMAQDGPGELALMLVEIQAPSDYSDASGLRTNGDTSVRETLAILRRAAGGLDGPYRVTESRFGFIAQGSSARTVETTAASMWLTVRKAAHGPVAIGVSRYTSDDVTPRTLVNAAHLAVDSAHVAGGMPVVVLDAAGASPAPESEDTGRIRVFREAVRALAAAVDARDPRRANHSRNVSELASALAQVLGLEDREVQLVALAALVHDVGKVGIAAPPAAADSAAVVGAADPRADHAVIGERILAPARVDEVLPMVRHHHERWDGSGDPDGLSHGEIPLGARILAVCDAFEVATSSVSTHTATATAVGLEAIESRSGSAFDPEIVAAFARMVRGLTAHGHTAGERVQA